MTQSNEATKNILRLELKLYSIRFLPFNYSLFSVHFSGGFYLI